MKISSFEASLIRNIKFFMVIFLASIVCLKGSHEFQLQDRRRSEYKQTSRTKTQIKHFARISRLQKFVISKSQNPEIASSLTLKRCDFWRIFSIWNQWNFLRMIFLAKRLDCLHKFTIYSSIVCLKVSQDWGLHNKRRSSYSKHLAWISRLQK